MPRKTAIVLAGGRSSRMGTPKALLPFDGEPLIAHVVEALRAWFPEVVVVAARGQDLPPLPVTLVHDEVAYQGPVSGIYNGLRAAAGEVSFVTSCDSVFLNPEVIDLVLQRIADHDVAVPHWQGRFQPLHAAYRRTVLPYLEEQLERGELRPVQLFDKVATRRIDEQEIRAIDPEGWTFFNMNTPEDYEQALARWAAVRGIGQPDLRRWRPGANAAAPPAAISCTVELLGVAQMLAKTKEIPLVLPAGATLSQLFAAVAERLPALAGRVISPDGTRLLEGHACSVNGVAVARSASTTIGDGDCVILLAADAGG
jgi:molybdopterin-guanine dinucleotide biosynthesis protein A